MVLTKLCLYICMIKSSQNLASNDTSPKKYMVAQGLEMYTNFQNAHWLTKLQCSSILCIIFTACIASLLYLDDVMNAYCKKWELVIQDCYFGEGIDNNSAGEKVKRNLNTTANKLYCLSNKISLLVLNYSFVHYKKLMKIQFLKNGRT